MLESFVRGFRMIGASIKMGWLEKRLLFPSVLTVFTNISFGAMVAFQVEQKIPHQGSHPSLLPTSLPTSLPTYGMLKHAHMGGMLGLNGPLDQGGMQAMSGAVMNESTLVIVALVLVWWLTNRFLEGVTTALVYSHLTNGKGSESFSQACLIVFQSLPAIIALGITTFIAKKLAGWMRNKRGTGILSPITNLLAGFIEIFWTMAGHLILPAIVIEGTSFWGGVKRADKIASSNLLTIGVGEVGVDVICRFTSWLVYLAGVGGYGYIWYHHLSWQTPLILAAGLLWVLAVIGVTAASIYVRAAFYSCLYVWAIDAESVHTTERVRVQPPAPLAAALA